MIVQYFQFHRPECEGLEPRGEEEEVLGVEQELEEDTEVGVEEI